MPALQGLFGYTPPVTNQRELKKALYAGQPEVQQAKAKKQAQGSKEFFSGLLDLNQFMPVTGDIQSGLLAANDVSQGDYGSAALNAAGLLPFVPGLAGMIKTPVGRIPENGLETMSLAKMLKNAGDRKGYRVEYDTSSISPSKYVTFSKIDDITGDVINEKQIRLSNHADKYPELANGDRISVDPSTGVSFENAVNWLSKEGYPTSLSTRYKSVPNWEEYYKQQDAIRGIENAKKMQLANDNFISINNLKDDFLSGRKSIGDLQVNKITMGANKRKAYEVLGERIESSQIPDQIKTNPDRDVLKKYLLDIVLQKK